MEKKSGVGCNLVDRIRPRCGVCGSPMSNLFFWETTYCEYCTYPEIFELSFSQRSELKGRLGAILYSTLLSNGTLLLCNGWRIDIKKNQYGRGFYVRRYYAPKGE